MIYITGDTLGEFGWIEAFCRRFGACKVNVVLSHAVPLKYEPMEMFMTGVDQSKVDKSTEVWLDGIEDKLDYGKWYCGHYHAEKKIDRMEIMFENFGVFCGITNDNTF